MMAQKREWAMYQERIAVACRIVNDIEPEELEAEAEADEIEATEETSESEETDETEVEGNSV